jgi:hypothetical protein
VDSLIPYLIADITLLVVIVLMMVRNLTFWHPLTVYLFFHAYSFTWRVIQLISGAVPMYGNTKNFDVIRPEEFERAIIWADVALLCFTFGAAFAQSYFRWKSQFPRIRREIKPQIVYAVCVICLPSGLVVLTMAKSGTAEISEVLASSGYLTLMSLWPMSCLIALILVKGFRAIIVIPICAYLSVVALQGYHRYMLVLPMLCLAAIYLQQKGKRWPTFAMVIIGLCMVAIFPNLKYIGRAVNSGDYGEAVSLIKSSFYSNSEVNSGSERQFTSEEFLDQYAGALPLIDYSGEVYKGSTYLALVTLPIPRALWPNKPGLADFLRDISTVERPYDKEGRIVTYIGESYANFRYPGVVMISFSLGFGLSYWCFVATTGPWLRLNRYVYIMGFMAFIQLFRDSLLSLPLFSVIHNLPALFILFAHLFAGSRLLVVDLPFDHQSRHEPTDEPAG